MYSMVLMMAMTASPDAVADGGYGCVGGEVAGCNGCHGGHHFLGGGGCHGGGHHFLGGGGCHGGGCHGGGGLFHGGGGCHGGGGLFSHGGGCHGGESCHGGGHHFLGGGCHGGGGMFGHHNGCHGGGCNGGASCMGGVGCTGGEAVPMVVPAPGTAPAPAPTPIPEPKKMPEPKKVTEAAPASIAVNVPAEAIVTIDGKATRSTSANRVFATPELNPGQVYYYTLTATVVRDGKTYASSEKVAVKAGETTTLSLDPTTAEVASK